jgi:hypothetical protein
MADDTNLDAYDGVEVWTRDASYVFQTWHFKKVGTTSAGTGIFTIHPTVPPAPEGWDKNCIAAVSKGGKVTQKPCNENSLAQRWVVNTAAEHTTIENEKYKDFVLQGHGEDTAVTIEQVDHGEDQLWTFFEK